MNDEEKMELELTSLRKAENELYLSGDDQVKSLAMEQAKSLSVLAESMSQIANFITKGGLTQVLTGYAKTQSVAAIANGLAAKEGRNSLDARLMNQNAIEISTFIETVYDHYAERLKGKNERDPELKDGEADFKRFTKEEK